MRKLSLALVLSSAFLFACTTSSNSQYYSSMNDSSQNNHSNSYRVIKTKQYSILVNDNWETYSRREDLVPSHLALSKNDNISNITISTSYVNRPMDQLCNLASKALIADQSTLIEEPYVKNNICHIRANEQNKEHGLVFSLYQNVMYAIHYNGNKKEIVDIMKTLKGNDKFEKLAQDIAKLH